MREILVRLIGEDQLSPVLDRVGASATRLQTSFQAFGAGLALTRVGQVMQDAGKKILGFEAAVFNMALTFNEQMAQVQTQAQLSSGGIERLSKSALDSAKRWGQSSGTIAEGLYDIFSSMETGVRGAEIMIDNFAQAATAGSTDVRTVSRSIISEMNALGYSAKDTEYLLDLQFQTVRKGVFTYEQFASAIGNVLPSAASMGQEIDNISGAIAFLSRQGFTASQSTISVARALDQLTRNRGDIKDVLGVDIVDKATGEYKQLDEIMTEFSEKLSGKSGPQIEKALQEIFGAGEIRANRFLRAAITNIDDFNKMVGNMGGNKVAGQLDKAFDIMEKAPAVQMRILAEQLKAIGIEIATRFIPAFQKIVGWLQKALDWFDQLSPGVQNFLTMLMTAGGVFLLVGGFITKLVGNILLLFSVLKFTGGVGIAVGAFTAISAAVIALGVAAYLIYKNWDKVGPFLADVWEGIQAAAEAVVAWFQQYVVPVFNAIVEDLRAIWQGIVKWWDENGAGIIEAAGKVISWFVGVFKAIWRNWGDEIVALAINAWNFVVDVISAAVKIIQGIIEVVTAIINGDWGKVWDGIVKILAGAWDLIVAIVKAALGILWNVIKIAWGLILRFFANIPGWIVWALGALGSLLARLGSSAMSWLWNAIKTAAVAIFNWFRELPGKVLSFLARLPGMLLRLGTAAIRFLWNGIKSAAAAIWNFFKSMAPKILGFLARLPGMLLRLGVQAIRWLWNGIKSIASAVWNWFREVTPKVLGFLASLPGKMLRAGVQILRGLFEGIKQIAIDLWNWFIGLKDKIVGFFDNAIDWLLDAGRNIVQGLINGIKERITSIPGLFAGLPGKIAGMLGIGSPSKYTLEHGRMLTLGLELGITNGAPSVYRALGRLTEGIKNKAGEPLNVKLALEQAGILDIVKQETTGNQMVNILNRIAKEFEMSGQLHLRELRSLVRAATTGAETRGPMRYLREILRDQTRVNHPDVRQVRSPENRLIRELLRESQMVRLARRATTGAEARGMVDAIADGFDRTGKLDLSLLREILRDEGTRRQTRGTLQAIREMFREERYLASPPMMQPRERFIEGRHRPNDRRSERKTDVHVNVRDGARGKEIARELDWMYRTTSSW
jgi:TP901 family phage tail tape measure protein